ncbi:MAG: FHA domain-containing protein [Pirellulales bacterium]
MFQTWRIQLRAAEQALKSGRLDDAARLVCQGNLPEFLPGQRLQARIAGDMLKRGKQSLERDESSAGWRDLIAAERLGAAGETVAGLRQALIARTLQEADDLLIANEPRAALARLDTLSPACCTVAVRKAKRALEQAIAGQKLAQQGNFAEAATAWGNAAMLRPKLAAFADHREACRQAAVQCQSLAEELHTAIASQDWKTTLRVAATWLDLAPACKTALAARRQAWSAIGIRPDAEGVRPIGKRVVQADKAPLTGIRRPALNRTDRLELAEPAAPRFLLWIDGVGGYLVCESREAVIGQPVTETRVDLPIQGDLSRQHAVIRRDGEGYVLVPRRRTQVDGRLISGPETLTAGCRLELGDGVRLNFRRPHPLSASARLDFVSHHRTRPSADAVLLMAESLVLGPHATSHVICPGWPDEIVLFRQGQELFCRAKDALEVDGKSVGRAGPVSRSSRVVVGERSFSLELV